jgi:hypothetical protein
MKLINLLINLSTNNDFYELFEARSRNTSSPKEFYEQLSEGRDSELMKYITLQSEDILYLVCRIIFELKNSTELKLGYLIFIEKIVYSSFYNASCLGQVSFYF